MPIGRPLVRPYSVICADPPWMMDDQLPGPGRGAGKHYDLMTVDEICSFPLPPLADDAVLFLWRLSAMVPEAYRVIEAWGFEHKSEIVWEKLTVNGKPHFGMGHYVRASHETAIIAVRGRPRILDHSVRSRFAAPIGVHSEKPEAFYHIVERMAPGPYVELFARRTRHGWTCKGNERLAA